MRGTKKAVALAIVCAALWAPSAALAFEYSGQGFSVDIPASAADTVYYYTPDSDNMQDMPELLAGARQSEHLALLTGVYDAEGRLSYSLRISAEPAEISAAERLERVKQEQAAEFLFQESARVELGGLSAIEIEGTGIRDDQFTAAAYVAESGETQYTVLSVCRVGEEAHGAAQAQLASLKFEQPAKQTEQMVRIETAGWTRAVRKWMSEYLAFTCALAALAVLIVVAVTREVKERREREKEQTETQPSPCQVWTEPPQAYGRRRVKVPDELREPAKTRDAAGVRELPGANVGPPSGASAPVKVSAPAKAGVQVQAEMPVKTEAPVKEETAPDAVPERKREEKRKTTSKWSDKTAEAVLGAAYALKQRGDYILAAQKFNEVTRRTGNKEIGKKAEWQVLKCLVNAKEYEAASLKVNRLQYKEYDYTDEDRRKIAILVRLLREKRTV